MWEAGEWAADGGWEFPDAARAGADWWPQVVARARLGARFLRGRSGGSPGERWSAGLEIERIEGMEILGQGQAEGLHFLLGFLAAFGPFGFVGFALVGTQDGEDGVLFRGS